MISKSLFLAVLSSNQLAHPVPSVLVPGPVGDGTAVRGGKISRAVGKGYEG